MSSMGFRTRGYCVVTLKPLREKYVFIIVYFNIHMYIVIVHVTRKFSTIYNLR